MRLSRFKQTSSNMFHYILTLVLDLLFRFKKFLLYIYYGEHEFERICKEPCDIYEKTFKIDKWLTRTNSRTIRDYWRTYIYYITADSKRIEKILRTRTDKSESIDKQLSVLMNKSTNKLLEIIKSSKKTKLSFDDERCLCDSLNRIVCYNFTLQLMTRMASSPYEPSIRSHTSKLMNLWNNLVKSDRSIPDGCAIPNELSQELRDPKAIVSNRWSHIGFQGEDPGTDFRGMGLLGLEQLEYLSRRSKHLAVNLLRSSLDKDREYPFAIVGINITYNLLNLFRDGSLKHFYFDWRDTLFRNKQRNLNLIRTFNDLYVELFLRFDCFWHESKPENIFAFRELMEKFINVIKMDLCNRTFSFKFIY